MSPVLILTMIVLMFLTMAILLHNKEVEQMEEKTYQGPVRPTDDLEYFRLTGITKPLENIDG